MTAKYFTMTLLLLSPFQVVHAQTCSGDQCTDADEFSTLQITQMKAEGSKVVQRHQDEPMPAETSSDTQDEADDEKHMEEMAKGGTTRFHIGPDMDAIVPTSDTEMLKKLAEVKAKVSLLQTNSTQKRYLCPQLTFSTPAPGYICGPADKRTHCETWITEEGCGIFQEVFYQYSCSTYWRANPSLGTNSEGHYYGWCRFCHADSSWYTSSNPWIPRRCCNDGSR